MKQFIKRLTGVDALEKENATLRRRCEKYQKKIKKLEEYIDEAEFWRPKPIELPRRFRIGGKIIVWNEIEDMKIETELVRIDEDSRLFITKDGSFKNAEPVEER